MGLGSTYALFLEDACQFSGVVASCPSSKGASALAYTGPPHPPHTGHLLFSLVSCVLLLLPKIKANRERYKGFILLHQRSLALLGISKKKKVNHVTFPWRHREKVLLKFKVSLIYF